MKKILLIGGAVILTWGVYYWIFANNDATATESTQTSVPSVQIASVGVGSVTAKHSFGGIVRAHDEVVLVAQVAGSITGLTVTEGQNVARGQVLARINAPEYWAGAQAAQTDVVIAVASEQRARRHWDDLKPEDRQQLVLASQRARTVAAQSVAIASKTRITAPFAGRVAQMYVDAGTVVMPGTPIAQIVNDGLREIKIALPQDIAQTVAIGQNVQVSTDNTIRSAIITAIAPMTDANSRKVVVTMTLPDNTLALGTFVTVAWDALIATAQNELLVIPRSALVARYDDVMVFVYDTETTRAAIRRVVVGEQSDTSATILSGLTIGEQIITSGGRHLRDGDEVSVQPNLIK